MIGRAKQYSIVTKKEGYRVFKKSGIQFVKYFISTFSETNLQHNRPTKADRMIIHMYQLNNTTLNFTSPFYTNNQIWAAYMHHINININYNWCLPIVDYNLPCYACVIFQVDRRFLDTCHSFGCTWFLTVRIPGAVVGNMNRMHPSLAGVVRFCKSYTCRDVGSLRKHLSQNVYSKDVLDLSSRSQTNRN